LIGLSDHIPEIPAQALMLFLSLANLSAADKAMYYGPLKASRGSRAGLQFTVCYGF